MIGPSRCYNLGCRKALSTPASVRERPWPGPPCYNLGCRKALSTPACRSQTCTVAVLQPRMSEGVEHPSPPASSPASPARCYNLGCRKALSTMSALQGDDRAFKVLQPRMSEGVEHISSESRITA